MHFSFALSHGVLEFPIYEVNVIQYFREEWVASQVSKSFFNFDYQFLFSP